MEYCAYCGAKLEKGTLFCPNCGARVENTEIPKSEPIDSAFTGDYSAPKKDYTESIGWSVLSFIFPIIGLILWLMWKDQQPGKANSILKGLLACLSYGVPIVGIILYFVWKNEKPDYAKICIVAGIVGFVSSIISYIFGIGVGVLSELYAYDTYLALSTLII